MVYRVTYSVSYYEKHNKRLLAEIRDLKAREGELLKENRELNNCLLQEKREVNLMKAKNRATREKLKLAKLAIAMEEDQDGNGR